MTQMTQISKRQNSFVCEICVLVSAKSADSSCPLLPDAGMQEGARCWPGPTGRDSHDRLGGRVPSMSMDRMHRHGECRSRGEAPSGGLPIERRTAGCGKLRVRSVGDRRSRARPTEPPIAARG